MSSGSVDLGANTGNSGTPPYTGVGLIEKFGVTLDGGGVAITNGTYSVISMPTAGVIQNWILLSDISGNISVDIKKSTYANYNTTASITGGSIPSLVSQLKNASSSTGWVTSFQTGDVMQFVVSSASSVTKATLTVFYIRA